MAKTIPSISVLALLASSLVAVPNLGWAQQQQPLTLPGPPPPVLPPDTSTKPAAPATPPVLSTPAPAVPAPAPSVTEPAPAVPTPAPSATTPQPSVTTPQPPAAPSATPAAPTGPDAKETDKIAPSEDDADPSVAPPPEGGSDNGLGGLNDNGAADLSTDGVNLGEIPQVTQINLTPQTAKGAVDAYISLKEKYKGAKLEDYETLQEFVDKDPQGKAFEADVKTAGFANVTEWNQAVDTVTLVYANILDDQTKSITSQIEEVQKDDTLAQDMKDRIVNSLKALIPTEANTKIVKTMMEDPAINTELKQLETESE